MALVLLDLSAAFDTIDQEVLLNRILKWHGIAGTCFKWVSDYLRKRSFYVSHDGQVSDQKEMYRGVPQGTTLGPLMFVMYTAPISKIFEKYDITYHLFSDDTQIVADISDVKGVLKLQSCLNELTNWFSANKLSLNPHKTQMISNRADVPRLMLMGTDIETDRMVKNLGVQMNCQFNVSDRVQNISSQIFVALRDLWRIRGKINVELATRIVNATILSRLDFENSFLIGANAAEIDKLNKSLNAVVRFIFKLSRFDSVDIYRRKLHYLRPRERITFKLLTTIHNALYLEGFPEYIRKCLVVPDEITRTGNLKIIRNALKKTDGAFRFVAPKKWNKLPTALKKESNISKFKIKLKKYLFS